MECGICLVNRADKAKSIMRFEAQNLRPDKSRGFRLCRTEELLDPKNGWIGPDDTVLLYATARFATEQASEAPMTSSLRVASDLAALWAEGERGDIVLSAAGGQEQFKAHSVVLAARSPVLRRMLDSGMTEATTRRIEITDISVKTLRQLCLFLYSGVLDNEACVDDASLAELMQAGNKYDVGDLVGLCTAEAETRISVSTVCEWLGAASRCSLEPLKAHCLRYAAEHLSEVQSTLGWQRLLQDKQLFHELAPQLFEAVCPPAKKPKTAASL